MTETSTPTIAEGPRTLLPELDPITSVETRRLTSGIRIGDLLSLIGAVTAAVALASVISDVIAPVHGFLPFLFITYLLFLAFYALLVWLDEKSAVVLDRTVSVLVHSGAFILVLALSAVLFYPVVRGHAAFWHGNLFTQDMSTTGPLDALTKGGIGHAIVGTLIQISIALAITIPLGITTALFLSEVPGKLAGFVRTIVEAMTALPSIVAGLFIFSSIILALGVNKSGFAAGLAITVMMLPIMIRAADVVFRLVPGTLKEASFGLGASQFRTAMTVVLPTSRSGLMTGIILATARGIGETSPVLLTAGYTTSMNTDPFHGPMVSLPLVVFQMSKSPEPNMVARAFATAIVLMLLVLTLFIAARILGAQNVAKKAKRKQQRAALKRWLQSRYIKTVTTEPSSTETRSSHA